MRKGQGIALTIVAAVVAISVVRLAMRNWPVDSSTRFWWEWIMQAAVAVGTLGAVLVALFGEALKARLMPPLLELKIWKLDGERTETELVRGLQPSRTESLQMYHVVVSNRRGHSVATQVRIVLLSIDRARGGRFERVWTGELPLRWRLQELYPPFATVGPPVTCDLCGVVRGKWLQFYPQAWPRNFPGRVRHATTVRVTLQAISLEALSEKETLEITWNGKWSDSPWEMAQHFQVRALDGEARASDLASPLPNSRCVERGGGRSESEKAIEELEVFYDFLDCTDLAIDPSTIEKRDPPEPDILCIGPDGGPVAFELAEICDPRLAQMIADPRPNEDGVEYKRTSDPSAEIVMTKLRKSYSTTAPIELLCYDGGRAITPTNVILPTVRPLFDTVRHPFRRAWLLDGNKVHLIWSATSTP